MVAGEGWGTIVLLAPGGGELASWPLEVRERPDIDAVDLLARLALAARRLGCSIRLEGACPELVELLDLAGLCPDSFSTQ